MSDSSFSDISRAKKGESFKNLFWLYLTTQTPQDGGYSPNVTNCLRCRLSEKVARLNKCSEKRKSHFGGKIYLCENVLYTQKLSIFF